jgi:hypothetical protein
MWGCSRWPECSGAINIDPPITGPTRSEEVAPIRAGIPAVYAQHRFEQEQSRDRLKLRALLPLAVGLCVIVVVMTFLAAAPFGVIVQSFVAVIVGIGFLALIARLPAEALVWAKGVEGERKTAEFIEPLLDAGFVVLYGRQIPGSNGDIDSIVIGPTGIFPIETKNWKDKIQVRFDRLFVGEHDRSWVVAQVYREALAVQVALGELLTAHRVTVTPIVCAIGGVMSGASTVGGVHVVDGKRLARLLLDRPTVFDDEVVQQLARLADQRLRLPYSWETKTT